MKKSSTNQSAMINKFTFQNLYWLNYTEIAPKVNIFIILTILLVFTTETRNFNNRKTLCKV